jgi:hypothetical protein
MKTHIYPVHPEWKNSTMPRFRTHANSYAGVSSFGVCREGLEALAPRDPFAVLESLEISRVPFKGSQLITCIETNVKNSFGSYWTHHGKQWFLASGLTEVLIHDLKCKRAYIRVNFTSPA